MKPEKKLLFSIFIYGLILFLTIPAFSEQSPDSNGLKVGRERLLMDSNWLFALGHAYDTDKDFKHGTSYFSYWAKTGYGDGPASASFDDRAWRVINLPHDWAVELPFDNKGSHSHGYKAIGRAFPETSVGWYRKKFSIPQSDLGRRIVIEFDGVHRDSRLFINGFYIGTEHSGYSSFQYDITDYLNYGGENIIAVRVDVTMEEGWFYEGAGIYRHVWLTKTSPLHVAQYGTFVTSDIKQKSAKITTATTVANDSNTDAAFDIVQTIQDTDGKQIASGEVKSLLIKPGEKKEYPCVMNIDNPTLWSLETPYLHKLITTLHSKDVAVDRYETTFGIRSVRFDPNEGFFLNDKHVAIKGTNNHQDHAGVGTAIPDSLQEFRINRLKSMGSNAYRCSHNPPTPELLETCDRLGMLVLDENRLMGVSPEHFQQLERMILRDRNHPCVIAWSLGNEEWSIEGNVKGARIASTMQAFAKYLDPTRRVTAAISGGWGQGISTVIDLMGYNYLTHGSIDEHHAKFPNQPSMLTEESTTSATRGVYEDDRPNAHMAPTDRNPSRRRSAGGGIERGIQFCAERPFVAGLFFWTGFEYRGEANPFGWPQVTSQFSIMDLCGFPKDTYYYLKSVWTDEPVLHILPHWNWKGKEGKSINVWAYSNCDEVELFLNDKSLGRKPMPKLSHAQWDVNYEPGILLAKGYKANKVIVAEKSETTGEPAVIRLIPDRDSIKGNGDDVSVITVQVEDDKGRIVPTADNEIFFTLQGQGKILGVGNGNPSSHEPDQFLDITRPELISRMKMAFIAEKDNFPQVAFDFDDSNWAEFKQATEVNTPKTDYLIVVRGVFQLPAIRDDMKISLFTKSISDNQSIYVNGHLISAGLKRNAANQSFKLDLGILKEGKNVYAVVGTPLVVRRLYEELNADPGVLQVFIPTKEWKRKTFNGLAQIIVQSRQEAGEMTITATSAGLKSSTIKIKTTPTVSCPAFAAKKCGDCHEQRVASSVMLGRKTD
jgi:beta-galactosidase